MGKDCPRAHVESSFAWEAVSTTCGSGWVRSQVARAFVDRIASHLPATAGGTDCFTVRGLQTKHGWRENTTKVSRRGDLFTMRYVLFAAILTLAHSTVQAHKTAPCAEVQPLLTTLSKENHNQTALSRLFEIGDDCIGEIISTLNNSKDFRLTIAAQETIRYLGNPGALTALDAWNKKNTKSYPVFGPVPVPIMEFDYEMIELNLLEPNQRDLGLIVSPHLYALAIDKQSSRSNDLLQKVLKKLETVDELSVTKTMVDRLKGSYPLKPFNDSNNDVAATVLENAFFLSREDKQFTTSRLLSLNGSGNKALVEIKLSRGLLAERWYHVVVKRQGKQWGFFSITFIKQS